MRTARNNQARSACRHQPACAWVTKDIQAKACTPKRGFTLIEVLATMVLLGILLPVTMHALSVSLAAASQSRHLTEAATLAQSKLNDLVTEGTWNSTTSGDFSPDHPDYRWNCQSIGRDYGVCEVMVTVMWQEKGQQRQMNLSTFVNNNGTDTLGASGTTQ